MTILSLVLLGFFMERCFNCFMKDKNCQQNSYSICEIFNSQAINCSSVTANVFLHCFVVSQKNDTLGSNMKKTKMEILELKGDYGI